MVDHAMRDGAMGGGAAGDVAMRVGGAGAGPAARRARLAPVALILAALALGGCTALPRGAALQGEVLAEATDGDVATVPDFGVEQVRRETLPLYAAWPAVGVEAMPWISRDARAPARVIAPGDTVAITVWNPSENGLLNSPGERAVQLPEMRVSSSGSIFLPYVGDVRIRGMSPERARAVVQDRYLSTAPGAQVQLQVEEGRQNTVDVVDGVSRPGSYPLLDADMTILAALSVAGGVADDIDNPQIRLHRGDHVYGLPLARLFDRPSLNTTLSGGDRVIVREDDRTFLTLGATGRESIHAFPDAELTALEALAIAGGVNDSRADPQGVLILRDYPHDAISDDRAEGPPTDRMVFTIDLTTADGLFSAGEFQIMPGDLVYATEAPLLAATSILAVLGSTLAITDRFGL
ncbi:MAG: polysaccharide biosynthesis/export family protein [Paracoccaceae bacterium]